MYLYLAIFWLVVGALVQIYWDVLAPYSILPVDSSRPIMAGIFLMFFFYNILRWRLARATQQASQNAPAKAPTQAKAVEYDPTFDFSKPEVDEEPRPK